MFTKQEASQLRQEFWTSFGRYMAPVLSADGEKVNWINYKTGEKGINFRMAADNREALIGIEIGHRDEGLQELYFEQFRQLRHLLEAETGEAWTWQAGWVDETGRTLCRIFTVLPEVSVFKKEDWPALISFFKPRLLALDAFWSGAKYTFAQMSM